MNFFTDVFSKIKQSSGLLLILIFIFIYFSVYTIKGDRGLIRYMQLTQEVSQGKIESKKQAEERAHWEQKVKLLSSESLDVDLLDERARVVLNMVSPEEFVILDNMEEDE